MAYRENNVGFSANIGNNINVKTFAYGVKNYVSSYNQKKNPSAWFTRLGVIFFC